MTQIGIGNRLRKARQAAGITQAVAAMKLSVSRPTLVAIEKGTRRIKPNEIDSLAECYGTSVNRLLAEDAVHLDLRAKFRSLGENREEGTRAVALLNRLASATLELERLLGIRSSPMILAEQPIRDGPVEQQAVAAALTTRHFVGIGLTPVRDIVPLLEFELGLRMFIRTLPRTISGVFGFDPSVGGCILLNARHSRTRQAMTAAHELGHFVSNRSFGDIVERGRQVSTVEERFANTFSYEFLMPTATVLRRFQEVVESCRKFSPRHLVYMARSFYVSFEAMCRRLESLRLLPGGTYQSLKERGFSANMVERRETHGTRAPDIPLHGFRLPRLATAALERGILSEGQVSRMLDLDRVEVREIIDSTFGPGDDEIALRSI